MAASIGSATRGSLRACLMLVGILTAHYVTAKTYQQTNNIPSTNFSTFTSPPACPEAVQDGRETSPMWGCHGEAWKAGGLLDDWSFAGYGAGLEVIPSPPVAVDVKRDFSAAGNGVTDDTEAVKAAIEATKDTGGVIYFPPGKYILSDQLYLHSFQVLRGAGRDATNLHFVKSLVDLKGWGANYTAGTESSRFTWSGALITNDQDRSVFEPSVNLHLGRVVQPAKRGDTKLYVGHLVRNASSAEALIQPGQWVAIGLAENAQGDMARMLYNNKTAGGYSLRTFNGQYLLTHMTRVTAVGPDWIAMERPLHVDISLQHPAVLVRSANYKVTGMGVEDLQVSFPWSAYLGHHEEAGYNAIEFIGAVNSWIRRVRIVNADSGVRLYGSLFNTISDIEITNSPWTRKGARWLGRDSVWQLTDTDGHMGIALHWASHDNLIEKFNITGTYYHDLLVAVFSSHNVFSQGHGLDMCLDHHGSAPNNNLWTDIDVGLGQAAMRWSGDAGANPYAGKLNTFWGISASTMTRQVDYASQLASARTSMREMQRAARLTLFSRPADIQGYQQVVVDMPLDASMPTIKEAGDWLVHYDPDYRVYPGNLYKAMVATAATRLNTTHNGTFLSDLYPRPASAAAWKPVPVQHSADLAQTSHTVAAAALPINPDCLNLGCDEDSSPLLPPKAPSPLTTGSSWTMPFAGASTGITSALDGSRRSWLNAVSKVNILMDALGIDSSSYHGSSNGSSVGDGSAWSAPWPTGPASSAVSEMVVSLKQVVTLANRMISNLLE